MVIYLSRSEYSDGVPENSSRILQRISAVKDQRCTTTRYYVPEAQWQIYAFLYMYEKSVFLVKIHVHREAMGPGPWAHWPRPGPSIH